MPTSGWYHTIHAALQTRLPLAPTSQRTTMSHILVGILHSGSGLLPRIAQAMPLSTSQAGKEQRLERFLRNPRIRPRDHFQPLAQQALNGLRVRLLLDRVLLTNGHNVLMVRAAFRRRSVPRAWQVFPLRGGVTLRINNRSWRPPGRASHQQYG